MTTSQKAKVKSQKKRFLLLNQDVDTSFLTLEMTWQGIRNPAIGKEVGTRVPEMFEEIVAGKTINTYVEQKGYTPFVQHCASALTNKKALRRSYVRQTEKLTAAIVSLTTKALPHLAKLSDHQAIQLLQQITVLQQECARFGCVIAFADIFGDVTNAAVRIVQKRKTLRYPEHFYTAVLGNPQKPSLTEKAYGSLQKITNISHKHATRFFWLEQGYSGRGATMQQLRAIQKEHRKSKSFFPPRQKLEQELNLSAKERNVFATLQDSIYTKSLRADARQYAHVTINRLLDRYAKKWKISAKYLETFSVGEFMQAIQNPSSISNSLAKRWKHSVLIPQPDSYLVFVGNAALEYRKSHVVIEKIHDQSKLHGQTAFPGTIRGTARLVFGPQHNQKVRRGDILIATATSPQLLPAMKRAAAFVTDMGGITSHAAIVARELNIPCVVGTKNATQVFHDGDKVEVDATNGIVRKL